MSRASACLVRVVPSRARLNDQPGMCTAAKSFHRLLSYRPVHHRQPLVCLVTPPQPSSSHWRQCPACLLFLFALGMPFQASPLVAVCVF